MSNDIRTLYPGRTNPADANYPFGSIKNESVPGANDGTPLTAEWGNDFEALKQAALSGAGESPNGTTDTAIASQVYNALKDHSTDLNRNAVGAHDQIYRRQDATLAQLAAGEYAVGSKLRFAELAGAEFDVVAGGTPNGYDIRDAGGGNTAVLNTAFIDEEVNVLWFGATADAFLSDAITPNPSRTDNHGAMQAAVIYAESKGINGVYVPSNRLGYYSSAPIRTKRETAQFTTTVTTGITIRGDGKDSILVGSGAAPANYVAGVNVGNDCILAIHCSNAIVKELQFRGAPAGIFLGHDPRTGSTDRSYVCLNNVENCWFYRIGTGVIHTPSRDAHFYNRFNNLHFQDFQIAIHQSLPVDNSTTTAVANRNFYETIKMNNGWAGFVLENGDTGVIESCNFESINGVETVPGVRGAVGSIPSQIHDGAATATAIHINNDAHPYGVDDWKVSNCHAEANSRDMYHDGRGWGIINSEFNLDKIALGPNKLAGTYQSNNSHTTNGQYASFNYGGYFGVKTRIGLDPFFPGTGETASDRGAYVNGFLYDLTGAPKDYDFAAACPQITALTSGNTKYSVLSKRVHWSGTVVFPQPSGSTLNVTLPDTAQVDNAAMGGVIVPLYVKGAAGVELTKATYLVSNNKVQIAPPPGGWAATGNEIYVNLTWKKN